MQYTVYKLDTSTALNTQNKDYYRVDFYVVNDIDNYEKDNSGKNGSCGWYTNKLHTGVSVKGSGDIMEYGPQTSGGSITTSSTIGGSVSISSSGPSGTVSSSYSRAYGTTDVRVGVDLNTVEDSIMWTTDFEGCGGFSNYPSFDTPKGAAKGNVVFAAPFGVSKLG